MVLTGSLYCHFAFSYNHAVSMPAYIRLAVVEPSTYFAELWILLRLLLGMLWNY